MPEMIRNSIVINRPIAGVFAFVTDPFTTSQWQSNLVHTEILTPGPMKVGTRIKEVRRVGKSENQAVWEITAYEPPLKRDYIYPDGFGPIRQKGGTTFISVENGTLLQFTAFIEARFPFNLLLPLLARIMRAQNDKSYAQLKQVLESDGTPSEREPDQE